MVLIPFTLAGGTTSKWQKPYIIALLVVGVFAFTGFVFWEAKFARYPAFPAHVRTLERRRKLECPTETDRPRTAVPQSNDRRRARSLRHLQPRTIPSS